MNVIALMCVVCIFGVNGAIFSDSENREIVELIETTLQCRYIPGMTLAVVKGIWLFMLIVYFHFLLFSTLNHRSNVTNLRFPWKTMSNKAYPYRMHIIVSVTAYCST